VVAVGEVVHLLELLVDNTDACLVCAVGDLLDVLGALAHGGKLGVDLLSGLNGSLGVELGYSNKLAGVFAVKSQCTYPGRRP
jgi:glycine cleavage system pyridoxal-binding protein P